MEIHLKEAVIPLNPGNSWLYNHIVYAVRHGSQAYGTSTPTSDLDVKGIVVPPTNYYFGFINRNFKQVEGTNPDFVFYEIRRYLELAAACNPNIIEMLWVDPSDHLLVHRFMHRLIDNRNLFLSRLARDTFFGYAHNQLKRIKNHRAWLLYPPKKKPERVDFNLPELSVVTHEQIKAAEHLNTKGFSYDTNFQDLVYREKQYRQAQQHWDSYINWQNTRNPVRHQLEAQFGYDTKHAMHLVRLIRMCREILIEGVVRVRRPDAEELLAIRNGAWTYDALIEWADKHRAEIDVLAEKSPLPDRAPITKLDELCENLVEDFLDV